MTSKSNLTINPQRLWDAIMETAKFGATAISWQGHPTRRRMRRMPSGRD